ncbi:phosphatidylinositol 4-phosphate 5-kinase-like protein 1 [Gracilinanus agilis]|uniref:phosphatidylinositol 4-phosphate 5-kinase-like protein 1 n=1 Tax=Gracilinanus agilis TaxID=191870 RepID=UPI001CFC709E|nr:phosphatidylinositol 4-phosphate 5-kinase-like protein 1 [Gracilinanus agilis]
MQSIFYPDDRIIERYDIKGCMVGRWTNLPPEDHHHIIVVLKDLNFEGQTISLDSQKNWFLRQVELDTNFLKTLNVLDYSLLLAFQKLHLDEKHSSKNLLNRVARKTTLNLNPSLHNLRLLLDVPNDLHILDGPDYRYFVGIIDFFTVYGFSKKVEYLWKSLVYPDRTFSTVNPVEYAQRLCRWVNLHTH